MSNSLKGTIYWHITEDCENPEAAFRVMMAMATHEGYMAGKNGVEGREWHYLKNDKGEIIGSLCAHTRIGQYCCQELSCCRI